MYLSILALPLLGSAVTGLLGRKIGVTGAHIITTGSLMTTAALAIVAFYEVGLCGSPVSIELFSWIDSEFMLVSWGFLFDSLTVSMNTTSQITLHTSLIPVFFISSITKRRASILKPKYIWPPTTCTAIVVWNGCNTLGSTLGYKITRFVSH
ncbi:MAG: hypothetical protein JZD40_04855 [Sulfolobus sp.]|nr:hypothetical protein [Sulfolobus sp.]